MCMGSRSRSANKQASKRSSSSGLRVGLISSVSSDGIEGGSGSSSSSSGRSCASEQVYHLHNNSDRKLVPSSSNHLHFVNARGSIFTLAPNPQQRQLFMNHQQSADLISQTNSSSNSTSTSNLDQITSHHKHPEPSTSSSSSSSNLPLPKVSQQEQHRQLQYRVHQQLQRIYGNADHRQPQQVAAPVGSFVVKEQKHLTQRGDLAGRHLSHQHHHQQHEQLRKDHVFNMLNQNQNQTLIQTDDQTYELPSPPKNHASDHMNFYELRQPPIDAIPEECDDEADLLLPEPVVNGQLKPRSMVNNRVAMQRKSQLENLQYATATAAALLTATADAAAAFAASEKHLVGSGEIEQNDRKNSAIYSDTYQEIRKQRYHPMNEIHPNINARYRPQGPYRSSSLYAENYERTSRGVDLAPQNSIYTPIPRSQAQIYHVQTPITNQLYQQYQPLKVARPTPPQPPCRRIQGPLLNPQVEALRHQQQQLQAHQQHQHLLQQQKRARLQQQQQQQLRLQQQQQKQQQVVPALAIVQQNGKNTTIKADLLSRMLVNNMLVAQRATNTDGQYSHAIQALGLDRSHLPMNKMLEAPALVARDKHHEPFSISAGLEQPASCGYPNVPLVLDRKIKSVGFLERICRIDLTIFWWSLLLVSLIFVSSVVSISRYVL